MAQVGGLVGNFRRGDIDTCSIGLTINSETTDVGGIVGQFDGASIQDCTVTGDINHSTNGANESNVGGFVGDVTAGLGATFTNLTYTGDITGSGTELISNVGGGFGVIRSGTVSNINITSDIDVQSGNTTTTGGTSYGGFAGQILANNTETITINNVTYDGDILIRSAAQDAYVGGFAGQIQAQDGETNIVDITTANISGTINSTNRRTGGFAGYSYG